MIRLSSSCSWALSLLNWLIFCWSSSPNCASMIPWARRTEDRVRPVTPVSEEGSEEGLRNSAVKILQNSIGASSLLGAALWRH